MSLNYLVEFLEKQPLFWACGCFFFLYLSIINKINEIIEANDPIIEIITIINIHSFLYYYLNNII